MLRYKSFADIAKTMGCNIRNADRPVVCIQGLGFVGAAMALAVANARDSEGLPYFNVIGVELPTSEGLSRVESLNSGRFPFKNNDSKIVKALSEAYSMGNLIATTAVDVYSLASVTIVDVNLDVSYVGGNPTLVFNGFRSAIRTVGKYMPPGSLIIIETTVPPGTCKKVVASELETAMKERSLPEDSILLAHSYERVMPGNSYFDSIVNYWRVYAGHTPEAADACEAFLSKVINVKSYPLTRLNSTTASETAKVLENSYRAANIAFIEEWSRFAEAVGIDLFEVISAISQRPTHSNIRKPGFGVGGYCLTKDPLFARIAACELYEMTDLRFPFCSQAVTINNAMPLTTLDRVQAMLGGKLYDKTILLCGVSYRPDVRDTRNSPSEVFIVHALTRGARVICHDPLVDYWPELNIKVSSEFPPPQDIDAIVFAVPHAEYSKLKLVNWLNGATPIIFDANNVLSKAQRAALRTAGCKVASIGRGEDL